MFTTRRLQFAVVTSCSIFLFFFAYSFLTFAQSDSTILGAPPQAPTHPIPPHSSTGRTTTALSVNPKNRQESADFFHTYYEISSPPDSGWTGS